jgi:predicted flap endonuclease-1-like 5' DNA nuclease
MNKTSELPRIGAPATRALNNAGVLSLEDLTHWTEDELLALHRVGPKAVRILREQLDDLGLVFKS